MPKMQGQCVKCMYEKRNVIVYNFYKSTFYAQKKHKHFLC